MIHYININKKRLVGRNNQPNSIPLAIDFHTLGTIDFAFINDCNQIKPIDESLKFYLAGSKKMNKEESKLLFLSKTYTIKDNIITFTVDTYTQPFIEEITKKNTEINVEISAETDNAQQVLLRDIAYANPRVYVPGFTPPPVDPTEYYTKAEVDNLLNDYQPVSGMANYALKSEIPTKVSELENDSGFIANYVETDPIFAALSSDLATKTYVDEALNNSGGNNTGRIFSDPKFLYLNSYTKVSSNNLSAVFTGVLGDNPPSSYINVNQGFNSAQPKELFFDMTLTYTAGDDFVLTPNDKLDMVIGSNTYTNNQIITCELYIDSILIRKGKIDYKEGFTNDYDYINRFSLIKLNEIIDDKKITGNCLLEIKIKFYNGNNNISYDMTSIRQNTYKIFTEPRYIKPDYYGLAKNLYIEDYYCYGKGLDTAINKCLNDINSVSIKRSQIYGDNFNNSLSENYVYYMPSDYHTSELIINGFANNSMIVFNTDPDTDFTYSFSVDSGWKINKPFNFQKGKSYVIATEANCIFWNEVQNYE